MFKKLLALCAFCIFTLICIPTTRVRAQGGALSCTVVQSMTPLSKLPLNGIATQLPANSPISIGSNYLYSFDLSNPEGSVDHIRSIYMQMQAGAKEPLDILGVRFVGGTCSIDADKRISCENLDYQYPGSAPQVIDVLVRVNGPSTNAYSSVLFAVFTDIGKATCASMNKVDSPIIPTATPGIVPQAVTNLRVKGYRSVIGGYVPNYKEAVLTWNAIPGIPWYTLERQNAETPYSFGGTKDTTYAVRFMPETQWDIAVYASDMNWVQGLRSQIVHVAYPGYDTLPAVPDSYSTPSPTSAPLASPFATPQLIATPVITPKPYDSTKVAVLEDKVSQLEQKLQDVQQTNIDQTQRIEKTESLLTRIRNLLTRWFRI